MRIPAYTMGLLALCLAMATIPAAQTLYSNGPVNGNVWAGG